MSRYEYTMIKVSIITEDFIIKYKIYTLVLNRYIYINIHKRMYGPPQAQHIAQDHLQKHLVKYEYLPVPIKYRLWCHKTWPIIFTLVVDDLGVKYVGR